MGGGVGIWGCPALGTGLQSGLSGALLRSGYVERMAGVRMAGVRSTFNLD